MNLKKDAYGQGIWAYFNGKESYELIERDDGFVDFSTGSPNYFAKFKNWPKIQKDGMKFVKGKVLDVGVGAGRVPLYLQKKGFDVLAIDNSPLAIRVCKKIGVKKARVFPIEEINKFKPKTFNTVIMYGNNFGLFGNFKKAKSLLKKFNKITTDDALIIAETCDPYNTKDPVHLSYQKRNRSKGRMSGRLRIRVRFRNYVGEWFNYLLVSQKEMKQILKGTGWKIKKFINSSGAMYVAIIEKEK
ncbi:MAG: methyltransferase domain-containing protein [archaeon]